MKEVTEQLKTYLDSALDASSLRWLEERLGKILESPSARELFMAYTLTARNIPGKASGWKKGDGFLNTYLRLQQPGLQEMVRIYILATALEAKPDFFIPKVAKLIEVADTGELVTFLKFLPLLPENQAFKAPAVEALRTNIATVFDAIALDNPYPADHFNEQQWNQMYLKAAFMQRDLLRISRIPERANAALSRIISDYAHERWAASRAVDPLIWQPVGPFVEGALLKDMERLLQSEDPREQKAGYLCCLNAPASAAKALIADHPLKNQYEKSPFDWEDITA